MIQKAVLNTTLGVSRQHPPLPASMRTRILAASHTSWTCDSIRAGLDASKGPCVLGIDVLLKKPLEHMGTAQLVSTIQPSPSAHCDIQEAIHPRASMMQY
jgi:hypothetical protein